jgi:hypothetical protein
MKQALHSVRRERLSGFMRNENYLKLDQGRKDLLFGR